MDTTTFISFSPTTNSIALRYKLGLTHIGRSQCVKDRGVLLDCRLYFHNHADHIAAQPFKMLGFIRYITSFLSSFGTLLTSYCVLVRSKLEFASVAGNSVPLVDYSQIKRVPRKFANLCCNRFFINFGTKKYEEILARLNLSALHLRRRPLYTEFLINVFVNKITCPSILITVG